MADFLKQKTALWIGLNSKAWQVLWHFEA